MKAPGRSRGVSLLLLAVACCRRDPVCAVTGQELLAPPASAPVWDSLKQAEQELGEENRSLPPAQRLADCRAHFQTVVEERVCHEATLHVCDKLCKTDEERQSCSVNQDHAALMQQCRQQALPTFTGVYSSCAGFHLCGEVLQPAASACGS